VQSLLVADLPGEVVRTIAILHLTTSVDEFGGRVGPPRTF
jgi:hypothetical protein